MPDAPQKVPLNFFVLMTFMGTVALLSSDIHISAMPSMGETFGVAKQEIQATFTLYLLGICFGQTFFGLLLNKLDVRRVAIISLSVFVAASFACAAANTLTTLLVCRFFQAFGASVCSVIYRSIVAARYNKQQVAQILSVIFPIAGMSPAIAPFLGGVLETYLGWRSIFIFTALFGIFVLALVTHSLNDNPKIDARPMDNKQDSPGRSPFLLVIKNRIFWGYALIVAMAFAAFRSYTAESPFIFHGMGFTSLEIGNFYLPLSLAYLAGNLSTKKLLNHYHVDTLIKWGLKIMLGGSILMVILGFLNLSHPAVVFLSMSVITFSNGLLIPCGNAAALTSVPSRLTGIAAALVGISQLCVALCSVYLISGIARGQFLPLSLAIFVLSLLGIFNYITFIIPKIIKSRLASSVDL
jgi:DHA1 family bicyclomycin/chloramphenicol resistance-like MFS transporter